jgi:hypothetical protein
LWLHGMGEGGGDVHGAAAREEEEAALGRHGEEEEGREEGCELLAEVHRGKCGNHASSRTLVGEAFRYGFYWPTALQNAVELVKTYKACQFHAKQIHMLAQTLQMIPPSWPFVVWGRDIVGPFPRAVGRF